MSRTKAQVPLHGVPDSQLGFWAFEGVPFFGLVISDSDGYTTHMIGVDSWEKVKQKIDDAIRTHYPSSPPPPGEDW